MSLYARNLINRIITNSESKIWEEAVKEWDIIGWDEDEECQSRCICGKEEIRYLYTIYNRVTQNVLEPIGSKCIAKFERKDLNNQVKINKKLYQLMHAIESNRYIELNSDFFSRELLRYLYKDGAFIDSNFNMYDGYNDYEFLLKMFNKRTELTIKQERKVKAIIVNSIKPYLKKKLK